MVNEIVLHVLSDQSRRSIPIEAPALEKEKEKKPRKPRTAKKAKEETPQALLCPLCQKGHILRGKTAYGCSEYKNGCTFRMDYATYGEGLTDEELMQAIRQIEGGDLAK